MPETHGIYEMKIVVVLLEEPGDHSVLDAMAQVEAMFERAATESDIDATCEAYDGRFLRRE